MNGKEITAHRAALIMATGINSKELMACHAPHDICGNRSCVNLRHLRWGTNKENNDDRIKDNTSGKGERNSQAKLSPSEVLDIRRRCSEGQKMRDIANHFGLGITTVYLIKNRKRWTHI